MLKIYDFFAEWCGPCKALSPVIHELIDQYNVEGSGVEIIKIDADVDSPLLSKFKIATIPTLIFEKNGAEVNRLSGNVPKAKIEKLIQVHREPLS